MAQQPVSVLFVCLGNICRSPTAHGVFVKKVEDAGLTHLIKIDSAGTAAWHIGKSPDSRSTAAARKRGYDLSPLRARQAVRDDFEHFDYVLAMDTQNLSDLQQLLPSDYSGCLDLFLSFHPNTSLRSVPDPYYGGESGFEEVLDLVEIAADALLHQLQLQLQGESE